MQSDDPAYLTVGTEVSAKFKGAFCEAKVKKVTRSIKIKVLLKESPFGHLIIDENALPKTAKIELNELVDVIQGKQTLRAVISNIKDCSKYHVVFNDGDEKELRRTQLCLKGGKHFDAAVNLDALPLYNPEQFSSPVVRGAKNKLLNKKRKGDESLSPLKRKKKKDGEDEDDDESDEEGSKKREKRAAASAATMAITEISGIGSGGGDTTEDSSADSSEEKERKKQNKKDEVEKKEKKKVGNIGNVGGGSGGVTIAAAEKEKPATTVTLHEKFLNIGKCVVVFEEPSSAIRLKESISISPSSQITSPCSSSASSSPNRIPSPLSASKASIPSSLYSVFYKKQWWPAVIVSQTAYKQYSNKPKDNIEKDQVCVRRFSDGKFLIRSESQIIPFSWLPTFSKKKLEEIQSFYSASSNSSTDNVDFSTSIEFTYAFVESGKLPKNWTMKEIFKGTPTVNIEGIKKKEEKKEEKKEKEKTIEKSSEEDSLSEDSDTEITAEERNFFIAQVYKFHEESASPINRVPVLGGKEIDLFNLQRIVQNYGGSKKVTANGKWNKVLNKLKLNGCPGATSVTIKKAYLRYLEPYSSFESKLGWATSDANISGARGERRSIIRPGHISMKQRRKSDAAKKSSRENSSIGSKEGSIIADVVAVVKSESPKPIEIETKKRRISENVEVREQNEEIGDELKLKLEEIKDEEAKSRENSITKKGNKKELTPNRKMENISGSKDDFEKKKKKDKSDISTTSNRPKTERKNVGAIPIPDANGTGENGENPDEGYLQSNIISHFYMGQKVRAMHGDRWYDARVVEIRQSKTNDITAILKKGNNPDALSPELKDELLKLAKKMECFVHYLGWNSRYDEWINLTKLKVSEKDQQSSRNLIKENLKTVTDMKIALAEYSEDGPTIEKILESIRDIKEKEKEEPVTAEPPQIQSPPQQPSSLSTPVPPNVPINIPLPVPIPLPIPIQSPPTTSQIVVNTIEKKSVVASPLPPTIERPASLSPQATGFGSPTRVAAMLSAAAAATSSTEVTVRDVAAMAVGLEARQRGGRVLIGPASNRNQKTLLHQVSSEAGLQALRSSYVPVTTTATYVAAIESTSKDEAQKDIQKEVEKKIEEKPIEEIQKEDKIEEEKTIEAVIVKQPETPPKKEGTPEKSEELRKSARKSTIASSTASINAQKAALLMQSGPLTFPTPEKEKEKEKTPQPAFIDTPIVARKLSNTVTPTTTTPFADPTLLPSTSKGVPNKRKRSGRGGFGGSGIDRKSHGKNKNEDDSDEEDLGGGEASHSTPTISHRADTFHSLKTKMHKLMEQNNELNDLSLLDLPDYDQLLKNTRDEDLSDILEARCFELREIYMTAKSDIVAMEKKKRRFYEKKREKEKKMRERRSMTPMIASTSNTISDL